MPTKHQLTNERCCLGGWADCVCARSGSDKFDIPDPNSEPQNKGFAEELQEVAYTISKPQSFITSALELAHTKGVCLARDSVSLIVKFWIGFYVMSTITNDLKATALNNTHVTGFREPLKFVSPSFAEQKGIPSWFWSRVRRAVTLISALYLYVLDPSWV